AARPRSWFSAAAAAAGAGLDLTLIGPRPLEVALAATGPMLAFLTAALSLAALAERSGLAERTAALLAAAGRGRMLVLYVLVCAVCALLTAVVSLDGAVVLMVPVLLAIARRHGVGVAPLLLGTIAVANAFSVAV